MNPQGANLAPQDAVDPATMLELALSNIGDLSASIRDLIEPIEAQRAQIRDHLEKSGAITPLTAGPPLYGVGAVDGAYTYTPLALGDHVAALSVAIRGGRRVEPAITGYHVWSEFRGHTAAGDTLAKAIMMSNEVRLLPTLGSDDVNIIDGSHITPLIAINVALASEERDVRVAVLDRADEDLIDAIRYAASAPNVVACPKADSSRDLWAQCAEPLGLTGPGIPDKLLAALVLEPGEVLSSERATPSWERLYLSFNQVSDPDARELAERFRDAVADLRRRQVRVFHMKPEGSVHVLRIEMKPDVDDFTANDYLRTLADDCAAPHVQEPVTQYVADVIAKQISSVAETQMHKAHLDLADAGADGYHEYLMHGYRT